MSGDRITVLPLCGSVRRQRWPSSSALALIRFIVGFYLLRNSARLFSHRPVFPLSFPSFLSFSLFFIQKTDPFTVSSRDILLMFSERSPTSANPPRRFVSNSHANHQVRLNNFDAKKNCIDVTPVVLGKYAIIFDCAKVCCAIRRY